MECIFEIARRVHDNRRGSWWLRECVDLTLDKHKCSTDVENTIVIIENKVKCKQTSFRRDRPSTQATASTHW